MDGVGLMTRDNFMIISMPVEFWNDILLYGFFFCQTDEGLGNIHRRFVQNEQWRSERRTTGKLGHRPFWQRSQMFRYERTMRESNTNVHLMRSPIPIGTPEKTSSTSLTISRV